MDILVWRCNESTVLSSVSKQKTPEIPDSDGAGFCAAAASLPERALQRHSLGCPRQVKGQHTSRPCSGTFPRGTCQGRSRKEPGSTPPDSGTDGKTWKISTRTQEMTSLPQQGKRQLFVFDFDLYVAESSTSMNEETGGNHEVTKTEPGLIMYRAGMPHLVP